MDDLIQVHKTLDVKKHGDIFPASWSNIMFWRRRVRYSPRFFRSVHTRFLLGRLGSVVVKRT